MRTSITKTPFEAFPYGNTVHKFNGGGHATAAIPANPVYKGLNTGSVRTPKGRNQFLQWQGCILAKDSIGTDQCLE
jgi:hypothetical protein